MKKVCKKCGEEKDIECFRLCRNGNDKRKPGANSFYRRTTCKECEAKAQKDYRARHREAALEYKKRYREAHKEETRKQWQQYYAAHKEELAEKQKKYSIEHPERHLRYRNKHRDEIRRKQKERTSRDPVYAFKRRQQYSVRKIFEKFGEVKKSKTSEILGCTPDFLYQYLIKTFERNYGCPWENRYLTEVHIDHIIPIGSAKTIEEAKKLSNYKNLQLLKARDNLSKSNKIFATQGVAIILSQKRRGER